jgi:hypothetical protein
MVRPAAAQNMDPALEADITRLMDLLNVTKNQEQLIAVVADGMVASIRSTYPDASPRVLNSVSEIVKTKFTAAVGGCRSQ